MSSISTNAHQLAPRLWCFRRGEVHASGVVGVSRSLGRCPIRFAWTISAAGLVSRPRPAGRSAPPRSNMRSSEPGKADRGARRRIANGSIHDMNSRICSGIGGDWVHGHGRFLKANLHLWPKRLMRQVTHVVQKWSAFAQTPHGRCFS